MKSRGESEEPEKENGERWLLTYSDLITLLLALFIILYTMSTIDLEKLKDLSKNLSAAFNNSSVSDNAGAGVGNDNTPGGGTETSATGFSGDAAQSNPLDDIYNQLNTYITNNNLQGKIELENTETYVKVRLKDVVLFVPDSPRMLQESQPILIEIKNALNGVYDKIDHVTISGHTADPENDQQVSSEFAWELSTDRAVTVLNYMVDQGLPQYKLSIEGYSHFNAIADNKTADGRSKNRRVEITISKNNPQVQAPVTTVTTPDVTTTAETKATTTKKKK